VIHFQDEFSSSCGSIVTGHNSTIAILHSGLTIVGNGSGDSTP
jgi:hypothetical protein